MYLNKIIFIFVFCCITVTSFADELSGVDVSSPLFTNSIDENKYPMHIIQKDRVDSFRSLGENLESYSGVSNADYGPAIGHPVIRGLTGSRTRIMSNGSDINDLSHLSADHVNNANLHNISHIEILRGPASIFSGAGASGGIVNVISDEISGTNYTNNKLDANYYSVNNGFGHNILLKQKLLKTNIFLSFDNKKLSNHNLPHNTLFEDGVMKSTLSNSDYKEQNMIFGTTFIDDWGYLGLSFHDNEGVYGIPYHAEEEEEHEEEEEEHRIFSRIKSETYTLKGMLNSVPFVNSMNFTFYDSNSFLREHEEDSNATLNNNKTSVSTKFNFDNDMFERRLLLQYARTRSPMNNAYIPTSMSYDRSIAFFQRTLNRPYELDLALRYEFNSRQSSIQRYGDTSINFGTSFLYSLSNSLDLYLGYSHISRSPNISELFANGSHGPTQRYERGNNQLSREVSRSAEIGIITTYKDIDMDFRVFNNDINDYIYLNDRATSTGGKTDADWTQKDAIIRGYELSLSKTFQLSNGAVLKTKISNDDISGVFDDDTYIPRMVPSKTVLALDYENKDEIFSVDFTYNDDQGDFSSLETKTNSFICVDAKYSKILSLNNNDVKLSVFGENLTNSSQRNHSSFVKDHVPLPGVRVGLELAFGYDL